MSEHILHNMTIIGYLSRAEYLLRNVGWCKGENYKMDDEGRISSYCLSGAINEATKSCAANATHTLISEVLNHLAPRHDFVRFNDDPDTKLDDIISLIHHAQKMFTDPNATIDQLTGPKTPPDSGDDDEEVGETDDESQIETDPDDKPGLDEDEDDLYKDQVINPDLTHDEDVIARELVDA